MTSPLWSSKIDPFLDKDNGFRYQKSNQLSLISNRRGTTRISEKAIWSVAILSAITNFFPIDFAAAQGAEDIVFENYFNFKGKEVFDTVYKGRIPNRTRLEFEIALINNWNRDLINVVVTDTVPDLFGIVEYEATGGFVTVTTGGERIEGGLGPDYVLWEIPFLPPDQQVRLRVTVESLQLINIELLKIRGAGRIDALRDRDPNAGLMAKNIPRYAIININEGAVLDGIDPISGYSIREIRTSPLKIYLESLVYDGIIDRDELGGGAGPVDEWPESQIMP